MPVTAAPNRQNFWLQYLSLFSSLGTLLCCALPSLLVLFGLGATVGSLLTAVPWLVSLSHHKNWVFTVAGVLIGANVLYVHVVAPRLRVSTLTCEQRDDSCTRAAHFSIVVLWISVAIYAIGFFVAYVLGPTLTWLDRSG